MVDIQDFKRTLSAHEYAFLIGNGINLAHKGRNWTELLQEVIVETLGQGSYLHDVVGKPGITNTEVQNIIPLEYNRKRGEPIDFDKLMQTVCRKVVPLQYSPTPMLDWIKNNKAEILTTNYDFNIENYLWGKFFSRSQVGSKSYKSSGYYPWDKFYCDQKTTSQEATCRVWHIHGDVEHWQSIILSLTRYMGAVKKTMDMIRKNDLISSPQWEGADTWLHSFFNKPLVFVGLALEPQELFLRWLLIERASRIRSSGMNMPPSYYLSRKNDSSTDKDGKQQFLKFLGVETVYFPKESLYTHQFWTH